MSVMSCFMTQFLTAYVVSSHDMFYHLCTTPTPTSRAPPVTFLMPIMSRGRRISRDMTASTTILAKKSFCWWMSLLLREVPAHFSRMERSSTGSCLLICVGGKEWGNEEKWDAHKITRMRENYIKQDNTHSPSPFTISLGSGGWCHVWVYSTCSYSLHLLFLPFPVTPL